MPRRHATPIFRRCGGGVGRGGPPTSPHPQSHAGEGAGAPREGTRHTRSGPRASLPAVSVIKSPHPQSHVGEGDGAPREGTRHTGSGPRVRRSTVGISVSKKISQKYQLSGSLVTIEVPGQWHQVHPRIFFRILSRYVACQQNGHDRPGRMRSSPNHFPRR